MPFLELTYKYSYQRLFLSIFAAIGKHFNIVNILLFIKKVYRPEPAYRSSIINYVSSALHYVESSWECLSQT